MEKINGKWVPFKPEKESLIQLGVYSEASSKEELKKMAEKQKCKE